MTFRNKIYFTIFAILELIAVIVLSWDVELLGLQKPATIPRNRKLLRHRSSMI